MKTPLTKPDWLLAGTAFALWIGYIAAGQAAPRIGANYSIPADSVDAGGKHATSANYTNDGSAGSIAGISTVIAPAETIKHGYIGQLYELVAFVLSASPSSLDEGGTGHLDPAHLLDDATLLAITPALVAWSVVSGPIASISPGGLATAGLVFQNTPATVQGTFGIFTGSLNLTVLDTIPDNFGSYAGDGVGDDWQVQYFGLPPNPAAGPLLDPDGDGQNNYFEWIAGLAPTDPASRFTLKIAPVPDPFNPGQFLPGQKNLIFSPRFTDRTYTIKAKPSLPTVGGWNPISASAPSDNGQERTITDLNASGPAKFYRVEITK